MGHLFAISSALESDVNAPASMAGEFVSMDGNEDPGIRTPATMLFGERELLAGATRVG